MARAVKTPIAVGDTVTNGAFTGVAVEVFAASAIVKFEDESTQRIEKKLWKVVA